MPLNPAQSGAAASRSLVLDSGWELAVLPAGTAADPAGLAAAQPQWCPAQAPGTAMAALLAAGRVDPACLPDLDAQDLWYRCRFDSGGRSAAARQVLVFEGLATLAEVWLNGAPLLRSANMFRAQRCEVSAHLQAANELLIRFAAVGEFLKQRRPRPRWRTRLVAQPQLRWLRASLLGRIPGWAPAAPAIGPWRPVRLEQQRAFDWDGGEWRVGVEQDAGVVRVAARLRSAAAGLRIAGARLQVGDHSCELEVRALGADLWQLAGQLRIAQVRRWWPHTHGEPHRYPVSIAVESAAGMLKLDFGSTGFRTLELDSADGAFALKLNGAPLFCRGACWSAADPLKLVADAAATREALLLAREAGMNMLRLGGTMYYEADHFYALCDELGILVWQDWMFASQDYPAEEPGFVAEVEAEARQFLCRTQLSPCLALLCGNSEVEQQAAMLGMEPPLWRNALFAEVLPRIGAALRPDLPYWPSSPAGGVLPFQVDAGAAHYFGVGAYLRPLEDARRSGLRFAAECLALANVPEPQSLERQPGGQAPVHHPAWKAGVPRDHDRVGWDFDDVRDHYLAQLFEVEPMRLRYADAERYLYLSRVVSGELMAAAFAEWRRAGSCCAGALVWHFRDLRPGAGWGLLDADGLPKAPWYYLKRTLAPVALLITDEGLNGLALHAVNDGASALAARLSVTLYRHGERVVAEGASEVQVPARSTRALYADAVLGRFTDANQAYRFGPPGHDLVHAVLRDAGGAVLGESFFFPLGRAVPVKPELGLTAQVGACAGGVYELLVQTRRFAQAVSIDAPGYRPSDNYFHLAPGAQRRLQLLPLDRAQPLRATLQALNGAERLELAPAEARA